MNADSSAADPTDIPAGIAFMLVGVLFMMGMDVLAKWLLETYALSQLVFLRCLFSVATITAFTLGRGGLGQLRTRRPGWHLFRSTMMALATFSFFYALTLVPLADIVTIAFAAPLIVTSLSVPLLGERVGIWRWSAVVAGFAGVLIVLQPGAGVIQPGALFALVGTFMWAGLSLSARKLSAVETNGALSIYLFPVALIGGAWGSLDAWQAPDALAWLGFVGCGVLGGFSFVAVNAAFRRAPASVVVPFEYSGLIWAAGAGYLFWGEKPSGTTWLGASIIIASGLFILYRETRKQPRQPLRSDFPVQDVTALREDG